MFTGPKRGVVGVVKEGVELVRGGRLWYPGKKWRKTWNENEGRGGMNVYWVEEPRDALSSKIEEKNVGYLNGGWKPNLGETK